MLFGIQPWNRHPGNKGINVATFNDERSREVYLEAIMLCSIFLELQVLISVSVSSSKKNVKG